MMQVNIYGSLIEVPDIGRAGKIEDWGTNDHAEQYWRRRELPDFFEEVEFDKDGNVLLSEEQEVYAREEVRRCRDGLHFLNNGVLTYITGKHYFYLQWWKLEDDIYPDYRDTDRRYFIFLDHWEKILWCLGIFRGKKRREGASSQACSNIIYECIFFKNSLCGLVSKSDDDSRDTFTDMVAFGYRQLPVFLQPKQLNNKDSVTELVFAHKTTTSKHGKGSVINNDIGHRSRVNYRAPVENAYDRGRISRGLWDEGGKWEKKVKFSKFISKVSKTMIKGAKRVGFCEAPSTVNEMTKSGGAEYKICWDGADLKKSNGGPTANLFVRYFSPAYEGYEGFIDKHGMSVITEPTQEQYQYLVDKWVGKSALTAEDIKMGAMAYLLKRRAMQESPELLEEEIRQNPFNEEEMFFYAGFHCEFNSINLQKQIKILDEDKPFLRPVRLDRIKKEGKSDAITFMDDANGGWLLLERPNKQNHFREMGSGNLEPQNKLLYQIGVDTVKSDFSTFGSKPSICVFKKSCIIEGEETGMYPVAYYVDKTRLDVHFDEEVLKACLWYGCTANYEIDARTDFYRFFNKMKCGRFLEWTPKVAQNPVKYDFKPKPGTQSGDPFQLAAQLQVCKMYIDGTDPEVYNGHAHRIKFKSLVEQLLKYDHANRTPFDHVISLMMALLPIISEQLAPIIPTKKGPMALPVYTLK
jgi:hypothetical protein